MKELFGSSIKRTGIVKEADDEATGGLRVVPRYASVRHVQGLRLVSVEAHYSEMPCASATRG